MMWVSSPYTGRTNQVQGNFIAQCNCDETLQLHIVPIINLTDIIFQDDNARPLTSCVTVAYDNHNVQVHPGPSKLLKGTYSEKCITAYDSIMLIQIQIRQQLAHALQTEQAMHPQCVLHLTIVFQYRMG